MGPVRGYYLGTGRRKTSVARVRIKPGSGKFEVNGKPMDQYFTEFRDRSDAASPLAAVSAIDRYDVFVKVAGGGHTGQAGAIKLGVARALLRVDNEYQITLRAGDYLTRDSREVERKKYGQRKARRRFQFSKR
ncbi:MAG: 30S ribosomal protein S9 [Phycisphaerae bacterium]